MDSFLPLEVITSKILLIRKQRVMLDRDLAALYGVGTKVLNQAVKRNLNRFPADFMFQLLQVEKEQLVTKCDRFRSLKHSSSLPYAFTEQGVAMLSSVLSSEKAIELNILIIQVFVRLRNLLATHESLQKQVTELDHKQKKTDEDVQMLMAAVNILLNPPVEESQKRIGFYKE